MNILENAIRIALQAHAGQKDKAGREYILHPLRVMLKGETLEEKIVGVLHDVLEDSQTTETDLQNEGFSIEIRLALRALTRAENESYEQFIERVLQNKLAQKVKKYDILDNLDILRLNELTEKDLQRLNKYLKALQKLDSNS